MPRACLGSRRVKSPAAGQPRPGRPAGWARCVVRPPPVRTCGALLAGANCAPTVLVVQSKTLSTPPPPPAAHPRISTRCDATRALAPPQRAGGGAAPALPRSGRASPDADSPPPPDLSRWRRGTTPPPSSGATLHARTCVLRSVILPPGREPGTMRTAQSERSWTASCTCCARRCACAPCSVPAAAQRTHTHRCVRASTGAAVSNNKTINICLPPAKCAGGGRSGVPPFTGEGNKPLQCSGGSPPGHPSMIRSEC